MAPIYKASKKDEKYLFTIKKLRSRNFSRNLPFLILSDELPEGHVYREFPDGHIELKQVFSNGPEFRYKVLRTLSSAEGERIRIANGLF
jgi:hypothetical protein